MKIWRMVVLVALTTTIAGGQTWQPLANQPSFNPGLTLLLTDGTVLVHAEPNCQSCTSTDYSRWFKLTPDANGSYVNGTWTQVASMPPGYAPLYFASAVLPDGRVIAEGGEYNNGSTLGAWTALGAIYDPVADQWKSVAPPAGWTQIGDASATVLSNGTFMLGDCCDQPPKTALLNAGTLTWTPTGTGKFDVYDEEGLTLLPSGKVLTVDAYVFQYDATGTNSEIYNPGTGSWSSAGSTIQQLWDSCGGSTAASFEVGPMLLRPDGTVFATGGNSCGPGHTAIYNSRTGAWSAGPDFPGLYNVDDGPAALEPNGKVLVFASPSRFYPPAGAFFEWDGANLNQITTPSSALVDSSFVGHLMVLPTGQIMFTDFSNDVEIFTPAAGYSSSWAPTITSTTKKLTRGSSYTVSGTRVNGMSQAAAYGDDIQQATNYPLVRLVSQASGHVTYCRTHGPSSMGVATGNKLVSTHFDVPASAEPGASYLYVVANGIPSAAYSVTVQ
jgi:hypothetical protein